MEKEKFVKYLIANKINVLFGAGAPKVKLEEPKKEFPLMCDLLRLVFEDTDVIGLIEMINKHSNSQKDILLSLIEKTKDNVEELLSALETADSFITDDDLKEILNNLVAKIKSLIVNRILDSDDTESINNYCNFFSAIRNLNEIKSSNNIVNIFSTNYDMVCEKSFERLNIHYYNGFIGNMNKKFNPSFYKYKYVENVDLNRIRYYQNKDHFNLYKIHGSFSWRNDKDDLIEIQDYKTNIEKCTLIYPSSNKFISVALLPYYSTLLREFSNSINQERSILLTIGYSYGDLHINSLIKEALMLDQFTLIACIFNEEMVSYTYECLGGKRNNIIIISGREKATLSAITKIIDMSSDDNEKGGKDND